MGSKDPLFKLPAFVSGPLTDLPNDDHEIVRRFYSKIGDACEEILGIRAFVPHERYDPRAGDRMTPREVDRVLRERINRRATSILIVAAVAPSWGGGIEVEMAHQNDVPVVILKNKTQKLSRLLLGNPAILMTLEYNSLEDALYELKRFLQALVNAESF